MNAEQKSKAEKNMKAIYMNRLWDVKDRGEFGVILVNPDNSDEELFVEMGEKGFVLDPNEEEIKELVLGSKGDAGVESIYVKVGVLIGEATLAAAEAKSEEERERYGALARRLCYALTGI